MENKWIPIEEMLPEQHETYRGKKKIEVLVTTDGGTVTKVQRGYDSYFCTWKWGRIYSEVVAWMPLPKGYKASRK